MKLVLRGDELFSAGHCPICFGAGALLLLHSLGSGELFLYCPFCGVGWRSLPAVTADAPYLPLSHFAPEGVLVAGKGAAMVSGYPITAVPLRDWLGFLEDALLRPE